MAKKCPCGPPCSGQIISGKDKCGCPILKDCNSNITWHDMTCNSQRLWFQHDMTWHDILNDCNCNITWHDMTFLTILTIFNSCDPNITWHNMTFSMNLRRLLQHYMIWHDMTWLVILKDCNFNMIWHVMIDERLKIIDRERQKRQRLW